MQLKVQAPSVYAHHMLRTGNKDLSQFNSIQQDNLNIEAGGVGGGQSH